MRRRVTVAHEVEKEREETQEEGRSLSSTSARVLAALMETRSRELPLTAAKPIYLRPRSLRPPLAPPFSLLPARFFLLPLGLPLGPPRTVPPGASFFVRFSRASYFLLA